MAPSVLFSSLFLILFTPFSSCGPQESKSRLTTRATAAYRARIFFADTCTDKQKNIVDILIGDGINIFDAQANWFPDEDYQAAMDMYLGTDSTDTTRRLPLGFESYLSIITANYRRARKGLTGVAEGKDFDYYLYCGSDEWSAPYCTKAKTWNSWSYYWGGNWGPYFYYWTVLCPQFWEMPSLASVLQNVDNGKVDGTDMNTYFNTPTLYFLAAYFALTPAISEPHAGYSAIMPSDAVKLATEINTWGTYSSTFNYIYAATAIFLQRTLSLPNPPSPKDNTDPPPASVAGVIESATFTPPASGLPSISGGAPNPAVWETAVADIQNPTIWAIPTATSSAKPPSTTATGLGGGLTPPGTTLGTPNDPCTVLNTATCTCQCIANDDCGTGCGQYVAYCDLTTNCCMCNI